MGDNELVKIENAFLIKNWINCNNISIAMKTVDSINGNYDSTIPKSKTCLDEVLNSAFEEKCEPSLESSEIKRLYG